MPPKHYQSVRSTLADHGWLSPVQAGSDRPVQMDELSCPYCDDDSELHQYNEEMFCVIECYSCQTKEKITFEALHS